ncbi:integrator complex subunit 1 [Scaptodrosophila lebanonensis]|uniref:Integrator complex subunit 1 n=1 Tax=Drosophila lebanonensis TaxID=7225 RepID=A0A6J2U6E5_DROLE|nr:integrator complex subunit 1 [Scaptodrosophila lebanonensis]
MDRNKGTGSNRASKKVHLGGELYALGTKTGRDDTKSKIMPAKLPASSSSERKREASASIPNPSKRFRVSLKDTGCESGTGQYELWEPMAENCELVNVIEKIYEAIEQNDNESVVKLLCGVIKNVTCSSSRAKVDNVAVLALMYIAKLQPHFFYNDIIVCALVSFLRREANVKMRYNMNLHILFTNLLARGFVDISQWPDLFLRTYIEDAINERFWADNEYCTPFVKNICAAFKTRAPPLSLLRWDATSMTSGQAHRDSVIVDDDSGDNSTQSMDASPTLNADLEQMTDALCAVKRRFTDSTVQKLVCDAIKDQLNKRQQQDNYTRNFLKFLCTTSGIGEVRCLSISRLELWIHNGKLVKFAQQLLSYICFNIKERSSQDNEVLLVLVKMRLKTKPLINHYMSCLKEMIYLQPDILSTIMKLVVQNELSNTRNPNNMGMLATMFQTSPDQSAVNLAEIYQEFLLQRDDCLRTLRVFLRELVRMLRFDVNLVKFCKSFLSEREELTPQIEQFEFRERIFHSMVDIVCLCMFLSATPQAREASLSLKTNRDVKNNQALIKLYNQMSQIQLDTVSWMYETVPTLFKIQGTEYNQALHKVLLLDNPDQYSRCDQWPSEPERGAILRIISETPIHEETLLRIILIGITKDIPFSIANTFDVLLLVIKRVSGMKASNFPAVQANKFDIIDFLFSMSEYHHPENIRLPADYEPPKLAIIAFYWKAWLILLMISAHNPSTFGAFCWDHYPTMKMLIEICITSQYNSSASTKEELQITTVERDHILQFETYLAAQTSPHAIITEENAILITQLMLMDPMGTPRKVPSLVLDQLKFLNQTYKLGHLFCRCRKPDLLLDIIQRQGTTQSMPWLSDLVQNSEGDFSHLPVQCLCEFLLFNAQSINEENSRDAELVDFLRNLIMDSNLNHHTVCEVLDYIFRRLSSTVKLSRVAALAGLKIIFKSSGEFENEWLLKSIQHIPHFAEVKVFIIPQLRAACQVENSPELIMAYIQFITAHTLNDPVNEMLDHVIDMAQLIVERSTMFQHIIISQEDYDMNPDENRIQTLKCLFVMFNNYIIKLREYHEPYEWTEYPDLLMVQFDDGVQLPLHINIIHAFIILLTYSSRNMPESIPILDYWFPPGRPAPVAFLPNMPQEPMQLLPDWLKLKMIRSSVDRLIEAALHDLTPDQIVLFVQNFGTPVNSMSKLLAMLDTAVLEQFDSVKNAILNKAYLAQLIEIQQARGAKNGHYTVQALDLHSHSQTVPDLPKIHVHILENVHIDSYESKPVDRESEDYTANEIISTIVRNPQNVRLQNHQYRGIIHNFLDLVISPPKDESDLFTSISDIIALRSSDNRNEVEFRQSIEKSRLTCTFLRTFFSCRLESEDYHAIKSTLQTNIHIANKLYDTNLAYKTQMYLESLLFMIESSNEMYNNKYKNKFSPAQRKTIVKGIIDSFHNYPKLSIKTETTNKNHLLFHNGLFIDWLAEVDPEIVATQLLRERFLFSKSCSEFRFYLLSLINHQTNWDTIERIAQSLFKEHHVDYDYSTVLNYFEALTTNPKLWKGREKYMSKNVQPNDLFVLNSSELETFTEFILNEGIAEMKAENSNYDFKLCSRMNLLFKLTEKKRGAIVKFVEYVQKSSVSESLRLQVLQQLYIMYPRIKFLNLPNAGEKTYKLQTLKGCQADKISNNLITCLGSLIAKKDFETLSTDTELLIRKLAASHPTLFLRQLSVLSSVMQGRAQNSMKALREEHHFHRFVQILRTLELLQPTIFDDVYKNEIQTTLACYFTFFKHHSSVKEACQMLIKFVQVLQSYISINPTSALLFIEQYVGILMELAAKYTSISKLQVLVQSVALLQHKSNTSSELDDEEVKYEYELDENPDIKPSNKTVIGDVEPIEGNQSTAQMDSGRSSSSALTLGSYSRENLADISPHFLELIKIIKQSNIEEIVLGPLQEIECMTSKRFVFINELFERLLNLIFSPSAQIRSIAFIILIRHLKHNPGNSDINQCALNAYIQCLRDENSSVAATAIDNLPEISVLLQEYSIEILSVAFSLGIKSCLNTSTQIRKVLQTLVIQHGY